MRSIGRIFFILQTPPPEVQTIHMPSWLTKLFGRGGGDAASDADELVRGFRKRLSELKGTGPFAVSSDLAAIEQRLSSLPPREAGYLAGFALLLAEVANVDFNVSAEERARIAEVLRKHSHLDEAQAELVSRLAVERSTRHSVESHLVFRRLNEVANHEQKRDIVRGLLYVAAHDDITEKESEEISFLARALHIDRKEYLELRSEFREHLAVLKGMP
jgi:uncharacterized tellurite resistance protein B-like protein